MTTSNHPTINETEYPQFISQAEAYYKTVQGGVKRKQIFTNEILYNIISISIEKYLMGFLMSKNQLPPCHTLNNMIKEVKRHILVEESLVKRMDYFDKLQFICALTPFKRDPVSDNDITDMMIVLKEIRDMVQGHLWQSPIIA